MTSILQFASIVASRLISGVNKYAEVAKSDNETVSFTDSATALLDASKVWDRPADLSSTGWVSGHDGQNSLYDIEFSTGMPPKTSSVVSLTLEKATVTGTALQNLNESET
jgi:hypothetical protein